MRITIIYQFFQNENEAGHSLTYNLAQKLAQEGNEVTILCGETGYMKASSSNFFFWKRFFKKSEMGAVKILRVYSYLSLHNGYAGRLLNMTSFAISSAIAMLFIKKPNVVLISSPPLSCAFSTAFICWMRRIPFIAEVRDLWPDSLIQLIGIKNSLVKNLLYGLEKFFYNHAKSIVVLTKGIQDNLIKRGWNQNKIFFIHCGVDFSKLYPDFQAGQEVRRKHNWQDKKIAMYFGTIGEAHNIEVIIRAAQNLKKYQDILFVLIGDGIRKNKIEKQVINLNLSNVLILPSVPKHSAKNFLSAADICITTLRDLPIFEGAIPTKLIDYMACGRPILCGIKGEAKQIVEKASCGYTFLPDDDKQLMSLLLKLFSDNNQRIKLGSNGYAHAQKYFSIEIFLRDFSKVINDIGKSS